MKSVKNIFRNLLNGFRDGANLNDKPLVYDLVSGDLKKEYKRSNYYSTMKIKYEVKKEELP